MSENQSKCSTNWLDWIDRNLSSFNLLRMGPVPHNHDKLSQIDDILVQKVATFIKMTKYKNVSKISFWKSIIVYYKWIELIW